MDADEMVVYSRPVDETHPAHPQHPEHPENHAHRAHHPHAGIIRVVLGLFVLVIIIFLFTVGLVTNAPFGSVILFFAPSILLGIIGIAMLNTDAFDLRYYGLAFFTLLLIAGIGYAYLLPALSLTSMIGTNFILGAILLLVIAQSFTRPREPVVELAMQQQELPDIIRTIEDRCKALNFVIGRVYSVHRGATGGMRDRIKIESDWYNELSSALEDPEGNRNIILGTLEKIRRRLELLDETEVKVFTATEVKRLKKLERDENGGSRVIDVLAANDSDPVEQYVVSSLEYANEVLERLQY